ncbi:MAG: STAS domain-containing protein [Clostridia bacterium]|nr:STAS domain-containing protein [Clostridia bacterium]
MQLQYELREGRLTAHVSGELGHPEAIELMARLSRMIEDHLPGEMELELSGLEFMDSSGIAVVLQAARKCAACGCRFWVEGTPAQAKKVLTAAGIHRLTHIR